jgi:hypothetical protein
VLDTDSGTLAGCVGSRRLPTRGMIAVIAAAERGMRGRQPHALLVESKRRMLYLGGARMSRLIGTLARAGVVAAALAAAPVPSSVLAADASKVDAATKQVEQGAKKIGEGKVGVGVEETAKGIGNTVVEGAKFTGEKFKDAGKAAEPQAKTAWQRTKEAAGAFGASVRRFFADLGK